LLAWHQDERRKEMTTIAKVLIAAVLAVGIGGGVAIAEASNGRDDPAGDVRGPCDEAEHANDPRCTGIAPATTTTVGDDDEAGEDVSGPCDEAEHANDPRCTGGAQAGSGGPGPGRDDDGGGEDRSGPSGPDNSGPGSDSSGPGSGGDDDHGD
ncbi:MAG: hypothetical protein ACRDNN_16545, partial [Gaiellaceae bacterium]